MGTCGELRNLCVKNIGFVISNTYHVETFWHSCHTFLLAESSTISHSEVLFVELENKGIHSTALGENRLTSALKYTRFMKMVDGGSHGIVQGLNKGNLMSSNLLKVCMVVW